MHAGRQQTLGSKVPWVAVYFCRPTAAGPCNRPTVPAARCRQRGYRLGRRLAAARRRFAAELAPQLLGAKAEQARPCRDDRDDGVDGLSLTSHRFGEQPHVSPLTEVRTLMWLSSQWPIPVEVSGPHPHPDTRPEVLLGPVLPATGRSSGVLSVVTCSGPPPLTYSSGQRPNAAHPSGRAMSGSPFGHFFPDLPECVSGHFYR